MGAMRRVALLLLCWRPGVGPSARRRRAAGAVDDAEGGAGAGDLVARRRARPLRRRQARRLAARRLAGENPVAIELLKPRGPGHRWFYLVTATGEPQLLCHADDVSAFDAKKPLVYRTWRELDAQLKVLLRGHNRVAMEWSPRLPALSRVDGGTSICARRRRRADLVGRPRDDVRARWSDAQLAVAPRRRRRARAVKEEVFAAIAHGAGRITEYDMALQARKLLQAHGLEAAELPVVAAGAHTADRASRPPPSAPSASPPATSCLLGRRPQAQRARRRLGRPHVGRLRRRARARRSAHCSPSPATPAPPLSRSSPSASRRSCRCAATRSTPPRAPSLSRPASATARCARPATPSTPAASARPQARRRRHPDDASSCSAPATSSSPALRRRRLRRAPRRRRLPRRRRRALHARSAATRD